MQHTMTAARSPRTRIAWLLGIVLAATLMSLGVSQPAHAQDGPNVQGTFTNPVEGGGNEPVEGIRVEVTDASGTVVGEGTSDADGRWFVEVPEAGQYTVTVDTSTLPEGVAMRDPDVTSREITIQPRTPGRALFPLGEAPAGTTSTSGDLRQVIQLFVEGIKLGLMIAMMAIGLSLVFGTTQLVNFAHGELVTIGAVVGYVFNVTMGMNILLAGLGAILVTGAFSALLDIGIFRQLRKRGIGLISQLVITIGLSLLFRYGTLYFFRGDPRSYDIAVRPGKVFFDGLVVIPRNDLYAMGLSVVVLVAIGLMLQRTRLGRAMRAVSDNRDLAESSGIDVQRVILLVWFIGGGLAALGGILWGLGESISWIFGFRLLLPIFAGVILGGIGTAYGALVGSMLIGIFIQMSTLVIPTELKNAAAMLLLAVILVIRPQGILGRAERIG